LIYEGENIRKLPFVERRALLARVVHRARPQSASFNDIEVLKLPERERGLVIDLCDRSRRFIPPGGFWMPTATFKTW